MRYAKECERIQELLVGRVTDDMGPVTEERTAVVVGIDDKNFTRLDKFVSEDIAGEQHMGRAVAD